MTNNDTTTHPMTATKGNAFDTGDIAAGKSATFGANGAAMTLDIPATPFGTAHRGGARRLLRGAARVLAAACLAVDAYLHAHLTERYDAVDADISQGNLFRIEAGIAALAALLVLVWRQWPSDLFAWSVAAGGLALLLIYRYADIGDWDPFPNMYEPVWYGEKRATVVAQAVAVVAPCSCCSSGQGQNHGHVAAAGGGCTEQGPVFSAAVASLPVP